MQDKDLVAAILFCVAMSIFVAWIYFRRYRQAHTESLAFREMLESSLREVGDFKSEKIVKILGPRPGGRLLNISLFESRFRYTSLMEVGLVEVIYCPVHHGRGINLPDVVQLSIYRPSSCNFVVRKRTWWSKFFSRVSDVEGAQEWCENIWIQTSNRPAVKMRCADKAFRSAVQKLIERLGFNDIAVQPNRIIGTFAPFDFQLSRNGIERPNYDCLQPGMLRESIALLNILA